jgi:hypothetical protein
MDQIPEKPKMMTCSNFMKSWVDPVTKKKKATGAQLAIRMPYIARAIRISVRVWENVRRAPINTWTTYSTGKQMAVLINNRLGTLIADVSIWDNPTLQLARNPIKPIVRP